MTDPAPTPAPAPQPDKPARTRGPVNQAWLDELSTARELAATAAKAAHAPKMAGEGVDAAFLTDLGTLLTDADALVAAATGSTSGRKSVTQEEARLKEELLAALAVLQKRAKDKYPAAGDPAREKFFIGQRIDSNHALLEGAARAIVKAAVDATSSPPRPPPSRPPWRPTRGCRPIRAAGRPGPRPRGRIWRAR